MNSSYGNIQGNNIENSLEFIVKELSVLKSVLPLATFAVNFRFKGVVTGKNWVLSYKEVHLNRFL